MFAISAFDLFQATDMNVKDRGSSFSGTYRALSIFLIVRRFINGYRDGVVASSILVMYQLRLLRVDPRHQQGIWLCDL